MRIRIVRMLKVFWLVTMLAGCASLTLETPGVSLVSLRALPATGLEQRFELGLSIQNPNSVALSLVGLSYELELEGVKLLSGVANELPVVPAYGEARVDVSAAVNLLNGVRLLSQVFGEPRSSLHYAIKVDLDTGLPLLGKLPVTNAGEVNIAPR